MKVKELVALLLKCDPELEICYSYIEYDQLQCVNTIISNVQGVDIVTLGVNPKNHGIQNIEHGEIYASIW